LIEKTGKKVFLLGVVPETTSFGQELSPAIKKITEELATLTEQLVNKKFSVNGPEAPAGVQLERKKG